MADAPRLTDTEIAAELAPLIRVIATTIHDTPVRLGSPQGAADLAATIAVHVAAYIGREVLPPPDEETKALRLRAEIAEAELATLRGGIRECGGNPTQVQNLYAQLNLRNRQWVETKAAVARARLLADQWNNALAPDQRYARDLTAALDGTQTPPEQL
ncbi:hypothetical protein [Streptomyces acidiscabies]|uniref:hypothetical protein n=1 Tax=Streptomyces acidiscabies TaxID=42234 RepID=UPI0009510F14|nr:hypothetical protein [Streptomyces acidiscabies]